jgi:hypothetical protein
MKKYSTLLFYIFIGVITSKAQNYQWARTMGGGQVDFGNAIAIDDSGNVITAGIFTTTVDFDPGIDTMNLQAVDREIFISKFDPAGNFIWAKSMGGTSVDLVRSISIDNFGNIYTTGFFKGVADFDPGIGTYYLASAGDDDIFISKLDAAGNFIWAKRIGGIFDDEGLRITVDAFGNLYTTGVFFGTVDLDPGIDTSNFTSISSDFFISKLDQAGNFQWAKTWSWTNAGQAISILADSAGYIYATGIFLGTSDFDPGIDTSNLTSAGMYDIFILKLDSAGNFQWAKSTGGTNNDQGKFISMDDQGNLYVTGFFIGTSDFDPGTGVFNLTSAGAWDIFIIKLNNNGNLIWAKNIGGNSQDNANTIKVDNNGNIYTTGSFYSVVDFNPGAGIDTLVSFGQNDIFISKLDSLGNFQWAKSVGGIEVDQPSSSSLDDQGNIYITGQFRNTVDFDPDTGTTNFTSFGNSDIFILKLGPCINSYSTINQAVCDSLLSPSGNYTWTTSGIYMDNIPNTVGCDSVITVNLTINNSSTSSQIITCDSYTWPQNGQTYTTSGTYNDIFINSAGCDSVITLNLTIHNSNIGTDLQVACDAYTWPLNSIIYTSSTTAPTVTLTNATGCDSLVSLHLTINTVSDLSTSISGSTISSNNTTATYQWLDCNNNQAAIVGETGQSFTALANGSYAVELTENGCVDTSICIMIANVALLENTFGNNFTVYPNPTKGNLRIDLGTSYDFVTVIIRNQLGQDVLKKSFNNSNLLQLNIPGEAGTYIIEVYSGDKKAMLKVVKE